MMENAEIIEIINENSALKRRVSLLEKWISRENIEQFWKQFIEINQIHRIGIYGYGKYGRILLKQIEKCNIDFLCVIDNRHENIKCKYDICSPDNVPELDVVIISTVGISSLDLKKRMCDAFDDLIVTTLDEILDCENIIIL